MKELLCNDKIQVIWAVFVICLFAIYMKPEVAEQIISNAFAGLFGIAVGQKMVSTP